MASIKHPLSSSTHKPLSNNWKLYVWCSSILMLSLICGFLLFTQYYSVQAQLGVAGTEVAALSILPLLLAALTIGIANSIIYPFLLLKRKISLTWKVILITLFVPALIISLGGLYTAITTIREAIKYQQNYEEDKREFQADQLKKYKEQIPKAISLEEATTLLHGCKVVGFYYTSQNEEPTNAERSVSGILSLYLGDENYQLHVAERQEAVLVPLARETKSACLGKPQLWHNGKYE